MRNYSIAFFLAFILLGVFVSPALAQISQNCQSAQGGYCVQLAQTYVPGLEFLKVPQNAEIGEFLSAVYYFLIGVVGLSAFIAFTIGGVMYLFSAGSEKMTSQGRVWMWNAVYGLAIAMISWLVLYTINPDLVLQLNLRIQPIRGTIKGGSIGQWVSSKLFGDTACQEKLGPSYVSAHTSSCPQPAPQPIQDEAWVCCIATTIAPPVQQEAKDCTKIPLSDCVGYPNWQVYLGQCISTAKEWVCVTIITGSCTGPMSEAQCAETCGFTGSCKKKTKC